MTVKNDASEVLAAIGTLRRVRQARANLMPLGHPMSPEELAQRAKIIETVICTSWPLQTQ